MTAPDPATLDGKQFALLLMGTDENGADDWAVFRGVARWGGGTLLIERDEQPPFFIGPDWFTRVRATDTDTREILLGAEFCLPLRVGPLPPDADPTEYLATGLQWPGEAAHDDTAG